MNCQKRSWTVFFSCFPSVILKRMRRLAYLRGLWRQARWIHWIQYVPEKILLIWDVRLMMCIYMTLFLDILWI